MVELDTPELQEFIFQGKGGQSITLLLSLMRIGFVPLFMLCNAAPDRR